MRTNIRHRIIELYNKKDFAALYTEVKKELQEQPDDYELLFYYARALTEQNYIEEARKAWVNLASKYPNKYQGKEVWLF